MRGAALLSLGLLAWSALADEREGTLDPNAVANVVGQHRAEVTGCFQRVVNGTRAGQVVLEWKITLGGTPVGVRTRASTMESPELENCLTALVTQWRFPSPKGGPVHVSYPFSFSSVDP